MSDDDLSESIPEELIWKTGSAELPEIGFHAQETENFKWINEWSEDELWRKIRKAGETNPALQHAIERVKILYHLGKEEPPPIMWHPV